MKRMAVLLLGLALLGAASPSLAQNDRDRGHSRPRGERSMPVPMPGPIPRNRPPEAYRPAIMRPGPDSLGADWGAQQDEARRGVRQGHYVPLGRAIEEIRRHSPGSELDAGLEQFGARAVYRVRWSTPNGRRIDYIVDAESGAILSSIGGR
jgi:hypothetical protein